MCEKYAISMVDFFGYYNPKSEEEWLILSLFFGIFWKAGK
jgi:hypothetical protein